MKARTVVAFGVLLLVVYWLWKLSAYVDSVVVTQYEFWKNWYYAMIESGDEAFHDMLMDFVNSAGSVRNYFMDLWGLWS